MMKKAKNYLLTMDLKVIKKAAIYFGIVFLPTQKFQMKATKHIQWNKRISKSEQVLELR